MLENYEHLAGLISEFNRGELLLTQRSELDDWIAENEKHQSLFEELTNPEKLKDHLKKMEEYDEAESWQKIKIVVGLPQKSVRRIFAFRKFAVAASIILAVAVGSYFFFFSKHRKEDEIVKVKIADDVSAPDKTKAIITLSDGRKISLDSLTTLRQGTVSLAKTNDGKIIYSGTSPLGEAGERFNTLSNPRGSKVIDMTLSDGSHVWLNAGSSVTYPVAFVGSQRKVSINGEAYFEVTHNSAQPFVVYKNDVNIKVLGTHFNVNAFDDEPNIRVTLLEGSVAVSNESNSVMIKPGQQVIVTNDLKVVNDVDLVAVMAWKNGKFLFNDANIETIMKELSRWYDVEVIYDEKIPGGFVADIPRDKPISKLLFILEQTNRVHFKIEGKKVTVKP